MAVAFHCSIKTLVPVAASPCNAASRAARPEAIVGMNALQVHQVISAMIASAEPRQRGADVRRGEEVGDGRVFGRPGDARPPLGLLDEQPHHEGDGGRNQAAEKDVAPRRFRRAAEVHALNLIGDERRQEEPERRRGVEERAGFDAPVLGNDLRHHGGSGRPLAADTQRGHDPEHQQHPDVRSEGARRRAERVQQHRQQQGLGAADPVGDVAEDNPAHRPAEQQHRRQDAGPVERRRRRRGRSARNAEQRGYRVRGDVVEEQAVEDVEPPAEPRRENHRPLVPVHAEQYWASACGIWVQTSLWPRILLIDRMLTRPPRNVYCDLMSPVRRLFGYALRYRRDFLVGLACVVVGTAITLASPHRAALRGRRSDAAA